MTTLPRNQTGRLLLLVALVGTLAAYLNGMQHPFVFDDPTQIVNNDAVHSWRFLPQYFTSDVWQHTDPSVGGIFYRPIFQIWLLVNYKIGGLNTVWWHVTSLVLHLLVTASVFALATMLVNDAVTAGITALLFGVHPVHVEAVTWISGVTEPLMAIFFVASFVFYLNNNRQPHRKWLVLSLVLYACSLLSKETAVMLPPIIVLYRWIQPNAAADSEPHTNLRRFMNGLRDAAPYIVLSLVYLAVRYFALKGLMRPLTPLSISTLILTWPSILTFYIRLLVWPFGLSVYYYTPYVTSPQLLNFVLPLLILIALALGFYFLSKRDRMVAFFSLWMVLLLLPVLNLSVFPKGELAHDRYLYVPSITFCLLLAMAIRKLKAGSSMFLGLPVSQVAAILLLVGVFAGVTARQNNFWSSDYALAARGVQIAPGNTMAANNLGAEMAVKGDYQNAILLFRQAIERRPDHWLPNFNLGYVYYRLGELREAEHFLRQAIQISSEDAAEHRFLGFTLLEMGRKDEAEQELRRAISLKSNAPDQHHALGTILEERKDFSGALKEFQLESEVNPKNHDVKQKIAEMEKLIRSQ